MNVTTIGLLVAAMIVGIAYLQRRRARLSREEDI
jgi:hypothetical protein